MDIVEKKYPWRWFRAGRMAQVKLEKGEDVARLAELDRKHWLAISMPVDGVRFDRRTLELMDTDGDGRIRTPEVLAAIEFLKEHEVDLDSLFNPSEDDRNALADVVSRMDLVFQDLKHPDPVAHRKWTGVDPAPIHANLRWLKDSGKPFVARIPLIPGVNDSLEAKEGFARLLEGRSGLQRVELLPYHLAAGAKYQFIGRTYQPGFDESRHPDADLAPFHAHGLPAVVM